MRRGEGLRMRLTRIPGHTPKGILTQAFYFPAILGAFTTTEEATHDEYDTVGAGRFSQPARTISTIARKTRRAHRGLDESPDLRSLDIDTLALTWDASWLVEAGLSIADVDDTLFSIMRSKQPVEVVAALDLSQPGKSEIRMFATIRTVQRVLPEGEVDTRHYAVSFKEWRDPNVGRRTSGASRKSATHLPARHKLTEKDTLDALAGTYYANHAAWRDIAERNGIRRWGQNTPLVKMKRYKVGSVIVIPKVTFERPPGERHGGALPQSVIAPVVGE